MVYTFTKYLLNKYSWWILEFLICYYILVVPKIIKYHAVFPWMTMVHFYLAPWWASKMKYIQGGTLQCRTVNSQAPGFFIALRRVRTYIPSFLSLSLSHSLSLSIFSHPQPPLLSFFFNSHITHWKDTIVVPSLAWDVLQSFFLLVCMSLLHWISFSFSTYTSWRYGLMHFPSFMPVILYSIWHKFDMQYIIIE